jgi:hypothetical protein
MLVQTQPELLSTDRVCTHMVVGDFKKTDISFLLPLFFVLQPADPFRECGS